ncbi:hypothetical protein N7465_000910, partial [Penicillium sp. CMV-2018d]
MDVDHDLSSFIFHHIFFPLKLPQEAESNLVELENRMVVVVKGVLQDFIQNVSPEAQQRWALAKSMLGSWVQLHDEQGISQLGLENALSNLKTSGAIACHVRAQNCGWVAFYDGDKDTLLVDAFEVSAQGKPVLSSSGGLLRRFPGVSVAISANNLTDPTFRSYLAATISQLASEEVSDMLPKSTKAGTEVDEIRETIHPGLVTEGLMIQLLALGTHNKEGKLVKCVRDEVNWMSALLPWRRSPAWLALRVALQLVLRRSFPKAEGRLHYKNFMLYLMATLVAKGGLSTHSHEVVDCWEISHARIGRRIYKLKDEVFRFVANRVHSTSKDLLKRLGSIQKHIKTSNQVKIPPIPPSASQDDLHLSLLHCKDYFQVAMRSSADDMQPTIFRPTHTPYLNWSNAFPVPESGSITALTEFEQWVDEHLGSWFICQPASKDGTACRGLENTIAQYLHLARPKYASNPQATSLMVLVVLELWVVLDKIALRLCPLLGKFSPGVPQNFLEPLLLPKLDQMKRAREIEHHINMRHEEAVKTNPSIFCDPAPNCFGLQYFESSEEHQTLQRKIEDHAAEARASKRAEWERLSGKHKQLCEQEDRLSHYYNYNSYDEYVHFNHKCDKCLLKGQAASLSIQVHEWPLPTNPVEKKTAVFELNVPVWFTSWRNTTWKLLHEVGRRGTVVANDKEVGWLQYEDIQAFAVRRDSNLVLASNTKSWGKSHYRRHTFPVSCDQICLQNGLRLKLFDNVASGWVREQTDHPTVKNMCTIQLPSGAYSNLQYTLSSTFHTQNQVMATQADCDKILSLHEFEAYGCLRSGEQLQWYNVVRNLASSALSLNEESVVSLIKQAAWELGTPSESVRRVTHQAFEDRGFGDCLLNLLEERLMTIKKNWNEHCTFDLIVTLGLRVLALSSGSPSVEKVAEFLRQCRQVAMDWCDELNGSYLYDEGNECGGQQGLILQIASTCQATYDVEPILLSMIMQTPRDVFCFARCSTLLFENTPAETYRLLPRIKLCLENAERIRSLSRSQMICMIMKYPSGLNHAIQSNVSCLEVSGPWSICQEGGSWVTTVTSNSIQGFEQRLHFNYLTGELLVDGDPPGRLPTEFTSNALYRRLFGEVILPEFLVYPGRCIDVLIESYSSDTVAVARSVHFGMRSGRLLIKTRKGSQILQLIPQDVLEKDFPRIFVSESFHWLDLDTGVVEFRSLNQPWKPCNRNWHLSFDPCVPNKMVMQQDSKSLVDIRSPLFTELARIFKVLDAEEEIVVTQTPAGTLEVELCRLRLKFFVKADGRVVSKEFGALIDVDQDVGCFYGLKSKLVLIDPFNNKSVIVPYGDSVVTREGHHVAVNIKFPPGNRVKYVHYSLDQHLQLLRGSYPLAILYQAYLHALTSFPVPDNLTHRSGTEEALRILRQESLRSSFPLPNDCIETLERIAALTPRRDFYPRHLRVMQTVIWSSNLGQLAQHDDFQLLSQEILQSSEQCSHFHDAKLKKTHISYPGSKDLLRRARCRNEQLRSSDFSGPPALSTKNTYISRDCDITSVRSSDVYGITALIRDWPTTVDHSSTLVATMRQFKNVSLVSVDFSRSSFSEILAQSVQSSWVALYEACQSSSRARHTYFLISLFSTLAFGKKINQSILRQLLQVAFSKKCQNIAVPRDSMISLNLTLGEHLVLAQVENAIGGSYQMFTKTNNSYLTRAQQAENNRKAEAEWEEQKMRDVQLCGSHIREQWPCKAPHLPSQHLIPRVLRTAAYEKCKTLCADWIQNRNFLEFLHQVQSQVPPSNSGNYNVEPVPTSHVPPRAVEY